MFLNSRNSKSDWGLAKLLLASIAVVLFSSQASAQESAASGIVSGTVVDAEFGGGVSDVRVSIMGSALAATTDKEGRFIILKVPVGEHSIITTANYYKPSRVEELTVEAGGVARIDVPIYGDESEIVELDGFTVKAKALEGSSLALLSERQRSSSISDAIGAESFSRLGIGDAAEALGKVTGTSIVDGKYVVVRGLSDRYNNTTLNGSTVPSADPDKRAVQLDQFPSGIIESIVTTKTFTPDKAGSFTGGSVNVVTKSIPPSGFLSFQVGIGYDEKTTFGDYLTYDGGADDWLGMDDGTRAIPQVVLEAESLPVSPFGRTPEELELMDAAVKAFDSQLSPKVETAPLDHSFSVAFGDRYQLKESGDGPVLGIIGSFNYSRSFSAYDDGQIGRYETTGTGVELFPKHELVEAKGTDSAQWGTILNAALILDGNHEFGVKTMYNQSGEDEAIYRVGTFPEAIANDIFRVNNLHYTERSLSSNQVYGEHLFEALNDIRIDWEVSKSKSTQDEPDFRLFYDAIPSGEGGRPTVGGNLAPARRYWRALEENTEELKVDIVVPFGDRGGEFKFGVLSSDTERDFSERGFLYDNFRAPSYDGIPENYLRPEVLGLNENGQIQRFIREFVGFVPSYSGMQSIDAVYAMADFRTLEKWRVIAGARLEEADVVVQSIGTNGTPLENDGDLSNSDWLPSLQLVREFENSRNLRLSYSRTLARPNFRELSPFGAFDNVGGEVFIGNPNLVRSRIENVDLRYEWFLEGADLVAVSLFGKKLENPIEQAFIEGQQTYVNVDEGEVYGIELEARRRLGALSNERNEISLGGNLSFIESSVDRSEQELADKRLRDPNVSEQRELQGQSGLIGNFDIYWERPEEGAAFSLVYNHTGERLYSVSQTRLPDVYQEASDSLDFIYSQSLPKGYKMKLSLKNLLDDEDSRVWADFNEDLVYSNVSKGRSISLSFSKRFE
ncbi:TonB-dependent receptor [Pelagicoccus sp. SDUM812005]|uniref:TonB-dependent receptor n=1 Tax=Pelagicoccus sp. SDUM812005 TaxID=3041257 RepID=UPI00280CFF30|nr:TonB-dependent receptor [Pelagicoccus sp. SDUM812005]MDQ8182812.1 TonB-dependent receptor [Pelagicoccus sp. SDUM812005]